MAHSLVGKFNINISPIYGERDKAFLRLQPALLENSADESLFAWKAGKGNSPRPLDRGNCRIGDWGLLAPSPRCFRRCGHLTVKGRKRRQAEGGLNWTQQGIRVPIPRGEWNESIWRVISGTRAHMTTLTFTLNCWKRNKHGELEAIQIYLHRPSKYSGLWTRYKLHEFRLSGRAVPDSGAERPVFDIGKGDAGTSLKAIPIIIYQLELDDRVLPGRATLKK